MALASGDDARARGVHGVRGDVFSFRPNVFTFRANVFSFRPNVFTFRANVFSFRPDVFTVQTDVFSLDWCRVRFGVTTQWDRVATIERGAAPRKSLVANADDASPSSRFREPGRTRIAIAHSDSSRTVQSPGRK